MVNKYEKKLRKCFKNFQLIDLMGFGNILGAKELKDYESYVANILENFKEKDIKAQKQLYKLAKDISEQNIADGVTDNGLINRFFNKVNDKAAIETNRSDISGT